MRKYAAVKVISLSGPSDGWAVTVKSLHTHSLCTKVAETCPGHGAGELAEPSLGYMLWPVSVMDSEQWLGTDLGWFHMNAYFFLACQISTWQCFPIICYWGFYRQVSQDASQVSP